MTDIDIDFVDPQAALNGLPHVPAVVDQPNEGRSRHPSGVYFQAIPTDPLDGMAVWNHREAAERNYFKVDFLANTLYVGVADDAHLERLLHTEPPWDRLMDPDVVAQLHQIRDHFDVIEKIQPQSVEDLAVCLALIRPGKRYLMARPRFEAVRDIWLPTGRKSDYKRSHAVAYATSLVVQLNLLVEQGKV